MDQLPSVGPGCVFKNIIDSNIFYTGHLSQIQRQAEDSDIIYLSSVIKNKSGRLSVRNNPSDVSLINLKDKNAEDLILDIYTKELKMNDIMDVQILLPQRTTVLGVNEINKKIRDIVNKNSESLPSTFGDFKVNDKVMQMKNNYELEVFNGDIGQIIKYDADEKAILVKFSDREVYYDEIYAEQLTLCYATTVHKSQGSEYKSVIFMVHKSHTYMLEKNLIYTAITRAKNKLYFLYDARTLYISQNKNNAFNRNTNLPIFLKEAQKEILRK